MSEGEVSRLQDTEEKRKQGGDHSKDLRTFGSNRGEKKWQKGARIRQPDHRGGRRPQRSKHSLLQPQKSLR